MNPVPYTVKSMAGPLLFVLAAFWFGQSVGRGDRRGCKLRR